jgi:exonuclease III
MGISVVTWNMNHWGRSREQHDKAWTYLTETVAADIMLLQEFAPQSKVDERYHTIYRDIDNKRKWGSAIITQDHRLQEVEFKNSYVGSVVVADVTLPNNKILTVISLYGMFDEHYVTSALHRVLSDLTPLLQKDKKSRQFIVAGDFNVSTQWDDCYKHKDPSHKIFFDRLEDFGLTNCTYQYFKKHVQTNRPRTGDFPWQNDYVFASNSLAKKLISCEVKDDVLVREMSDHNPVIAVFDV